jgi:uncharacterized protein (TIGR01244 family)
MQSVIGIPNERRPQPELVCGGQPTASQLAAAKEQGVTTIINLRPASEMAACGFDEAAQVAGLGLTYVQIAVAGPGDINALNASALHAAVEAASGSVMIHCASGTRGGALLALAQRRHHGKSAEEALAFGRAAGLTALEAFVRGVL